jgi:RNA-directed DNA polymerase
LDEVGKELEKRGLVFCRYADDLNVYARSKRAAEDAVQTLRGLFAKLRLQVNESKSAVARPWERKFLGYTFWVAKKTGELKRAVATMAFGCRPDARPCARSDRPLEGDVRVGIGQIGPRFR